MTRSFGLAVAVLTLTLVACTGVRHTTQYSPSYDYQNFSTYLADKNTPVEVHGNPFGLTPDAFAKAVTDRMQGHTAGRQTNFTADPDAAAEKNMRVVMAFNAMPAGSGDLCSATTFNPQPAGELTMQAAWCWSHSPESEVRSWAGPVTGVNDPKFDQMIAAATRDLFPPREGRRQMRDDDDDDDPVP